MSSGTPPIDSQHDDGSQELPPRHIVISEIRQAVAAGIREAASDPKLWSDISRAIRVQAQQEAGGWLFGGVRAAFSKVFWITFVGIGVYLLGGWSAVVALFKTVTPP